MGAEPLDGLRPALLRGDERLVVEVSLGVGDVEVAVDHQHLHREGVELQRVVHSMLGNSSEEGEERAEDHTEVGEGHHQPGGEFRLLPDRLEAQRDDRLVQQLPEDRRLIVSHHIKATQRR